MFVYCKMYVIFAVYNSLECLSLFIYTVFELKSN